MSVTLIPTNVHEVSAAHYRARLASNPAATRDFTLVWYSGKTCCEPGDPTHGYHTWTDFPGVWEVAPDSFEPMDSVQCHNCGSRFGTRARLADGHLGPVKTDILATEVRSEVDHFRDKWRSDRLIELSAALAEVVDGNERPDGTDTEPGVWWDGSNLIAWDYDPWDEDRTLEVVG